MKKNVKRKMAGFLTVLLSASAVLGNATPAFAWERQAVSSEADNSDELLEQITAKKDLIGRDESSLENTLRPEKAGYDSQMETKQGDIASCSENIATLTSQIEALEAIVPRPEDYDTRMGELTSQKAEQEGIRTGLASDIASLEESIADVNARITAKEEEIQQASEVINDLLTDYGELMTTAHSAVREQWKTKFQTAFTNCDATKIELKVNGDLIPGITRSEVGEIMAEVINADAYLFYVQSPDIELSSVVNPETGTYDIVSVTPEYNRTKAEMDELRAKVADIVSGAEGLGQPSATDGTITSFNNPTLTAIYAHDYIVRNTEKKDEPLTGGGYDAYDVLVGGEGASIGYADAFSVLFYALTDSELQGVVCDTIYSIEGNIFADPNNAMVWNMITTPAQPGVASQLNGGNGFKTYINCYADDVYGTQTQMVSHEYMFRNASNMDRPEEAQWKLYDWMISCIGVMGKEIGEDIDKTDAGIYDVETDNAVSWLSSVNSPLLIDTVQIGGEEATATYRSCVYGTISKNTGNQVCLAFGESGTERKSVSGQNAYKLYDYATKTQATPTTLGRMNDFACISDKTDLGGLVWSDGKTIYYTNNVNASLVTEAEDETLEANKLYELSHAQVAHGEIYNIRISPAVPSTGSEEPAYSMLTFDIGRMYKDSSNRYFYEKTKEVTTRYALAPAEEPTPSPEDPSPSPEAPTPTEEPDIAEMGADTFTVSVQTVTGGVSIIKVTLIDETLTAIKLPEKFEGKDVVGIGSRAVSGLYGLKTVILPSSIKALESNSLRMCPELDKIVFLGEAPSIGKNSFYLTSTKAVALYLNGPTWTESVKEGYGNNSLRWVAYKSDKLAELLTMRSEDIVETEPAEEDPTPSGGDPDPTGGDPNPTGGDPDPTGGDEEPTPEEPKRSGDFTYYEMEGGVSINSYVGTEKVIRIPERIQGKDVIEIGEKAFYRQYFKDEVHIPATVVKIDSKAFDSCYLKRMYFYGEAPEIADDAFAYIGAATPLTVYVPKNDSTWNAQSKKNYGAYNVEYATWEVENEKVEPITEADFRYTVSNDMVEIQSFVGSQKVVVIPDAFVLDGRSLSVNKIQMVAFAGKDITKVVIPASVTEIGMHAFSRCYDLRTVSFNGAAPMIDEQAFADVTATVYHPHEGWTVDNERSYGGTLVYRVYGEKTENPEKPVPTPVPDPEPVSANDLDYSIIDEVIVIEGYNGVSTNVVLPASISENGAYLPVKTIAAGAFAGTDINRIVIPESVTLIENSAFARCAGLEDITFKGDAPVIMQKAFLDVTATVHFPRLKSWTEDVQKDYGGTLTYEPYGDELKPEPSPFEPEPVRYYEYSVVSGNNAYAIIESYKGVSENISIPETISENGSKYPVREIAPGAFAGEGFVSVTIPASVTAIGASAFVRCTGLSAIFYKGDAPEISNRAFTGVTATVYYPRSAEWPKDKMLDYGGTLTYEGYGEAKPVKPEPTDTKMFSYDVVNEDGKYVLIRGYEGKDTEVIIPASISVNKIDIPVRKIDNTAFAGTKITSIVFPDTIDEIGNYAFSRCAELKSIYFEGAAPKIASSSFKDVTATVYHPYKGWESANKQNYGGTLAYEAVGDKEDPTPTPVGPTPTPVPKDSAFYVEFDSAESYTYTGSAVEPEVNVFYQNKRLVAGIDYKVTYENNVRVGKDAVVTVRGITVPGTATHSFAIHEKSLSDADIEAFAITTAKGKKVSPNIFHNGRVLTKKDYEISGQDSFTKDGYLKVKGIGNYRDSLMIPVKVQEPLKMKVKFSFEKHYYDGTAQTLSSNEIDVIGLDKDGEATDKEMKEGVDYQILFRGDLVNAGTVKVTVIGIGDYAGKATKTFRILPNKTSDFIFYADGQKELTTAFREGGVKPAITVRADDGSWLRPDKDYRVTYSANKKIGTGKFTVSFRGNYNGTKALKGTFDIVEAKMSDAVVYATDKVFTKDGNYITAPIVVMNGTVLKKSSYDVEYSIGKKVCEDDLTDGSLIVDFTVSGKGNYEGEATGSYVIEKAKSGYDLSKKSVQIYDNKNKKKVTTVEYNGTPVLFDKQPYSLNVYKEKNGKTLTEGKDYIVTYIRNEGKGTGYVMITGIGDYAGSKLVKFKLKAGKITWNEKKDD